MYYQITITKIEDNVNFEQEMAKFLEATKYQRNSWDSGPEPLRPNRTLEVNALSLIASEEQFEVIRKASLENF